MKSLIYIIGILVVLAAAVFTVLNADKHKELTKQTFDLRKHNDSLDDEIKGKEGLKLAIDDYKDAGDNPLGKNDQEKLVNSISLIRQRAISGSKEPLAFSAASLNSKYQRNVEGKKFEFVAFNKMAATPESSAKFEKELDFINSEATDIVSGEALVTGSDEFGQRLGLYIDKTLSGQLKDLTKDISSNKSEISDLEGEIKKYAEAEKKIETMFSSEGINGLQGGKDKLKELEAKRKELLDKQDVLEKEKEALTEKKDNNLVRLKGQAEYIAKRKVSIGGNAKTYKIAASDFEWGFVIVHAHEVANFYINQDLYLLRKGSYIGTVKVTSVEPGRVMANIIYDTVASGVVFRKGDTVIPAKSADR